MKSKVFILSLALCLTVALSALNKDNQVAVRECKILEYNRLVNSAFENKVLFERKQNAMQDLNEEQERDIRACHTIALERREIGVNKMVLHGATFGVWVPILFKYVAVKDRADLLDADTVRDLASAIFITLQLRKCMVDQKNKYIQLQQLERSLREKLSAQNIVLDDLPKRNSFLTSSFCVGVGLSALTHFALKTAASSGRVNSDDLLSAFVIKAPTLMVLLPSLLIGNDDDFNKKRSICLSLKDKKLQLPVNACE